MYIIIILLFIIIFPFSIVSHHFSELVFESELICDGEFIQNESQIDQSVDYENCSRNIYFTPKECCQLCMFNGLWKNHKLIGGRCLFDPSFQSDNRDLFNESQIPNNPYVKKQECCYFCGHEAFSYRFTLDYDSDNQENGFCAPVNYTEIETEIVRRKYSLKSLGISSIVQCISCKALGSFLEMIKGDAIETVMAEVKVFCSGMIFFAEMCRNFVNNQLTNLIKNATTYIDSDHLCYKIIPACKNEFSLGAPRSRTTILSDLDGDVLPEGSLAALPQFNYDTLVYEYLGGPTYDPNTYEKTLKWLVRHGLIANRVVCRNCQNHEAALVKRSCSSDLYTWRCNHCRHASGNEQSQIMSLRVGSFFAQSHLSFQQILKLAYYWSNHPSSTLETIMREVTFTDKATIIEYYLAFRDLCQHWAERVQVNERLGGIGAIVEVDESKLFRAKHNRGRMLNNDYYWVFGMIERHTNKVRLFPVVKRDAPTLLGIIAEHVAPQSTVISDGWRAYGGVTALQQQFTHQWINHKLNFVDPRDPNIHTQSIEGTWSALKSSLRHLHGTTPQMLPSYLFQYMFRRAHDNEKIFQHILEKMRLAYPV